MSQIDVIIGPRNFELVRDRIGEILIDEFAGQVTLGSDVEIGSIWVGRTRPFDLTELPALNVSTAKGTFGGKHLNAMADGEFIYNIDGYVAKESTADRAGDELSNELLDRIMGIAQYILDDAKYKTLGYARGFIGSRGTIDLQIAQANKDDQNNIQMARLTFAVKIGDWNAPIVPPMITGYDTKVKLGNTLKGYYFKGDNY